MSTITPPACDADPSEIPPLPADFWAIEAMQSEDELKRDLELTCSTCREHLADIEPGDSIAVLYATAAAHVRAAHARPTNLCADCSPDGVADPRADVTHCENCSGPIHPTSRIHGYTPRSL